MEHVFKDLKTPHIWAWGALIVAGVILVILFTNGSVPTPIKGWLALACHICLCIFLAPCVIRAANDDHRHLLTVILWSFVAVILGIVALYFAFFAIAGAEYAKYDKLLNVVTVFVAIWGAGVGWLVHFKLTSKAHRTNNAFAIIMETRKSSEFLKRGELVSKHFPPGSKTIPEAYRKYFSPSAVARAMHDHEITTEEKEKAEATHALKYVLNYYEFMAVGIRAGDLDENLIYETIHPSVCAVFDRSKLFVEYLCDPNNPGGDSTTYCELKELVSRWKKRRSAQDAA